MLKYFTVSNDLLQVLNQLMSLSRLVDFRLVGGTALSLQLGHRKSDDIDLFASLPYGSIDFAAIKHQVTENLEEVVDDDDILKSADGANNFGLHLHIIGNDGEPVKTDILNWTTSDFIEAPLVIDGIRMATVQEIALMKLDSIGRGGRKKDFWDLSEIFSIHDPKELIQSYPTKYPYHNVDDVVNGLVNFEQADNMPDPICLRGKYWDLIKQEMVSVQESIKQP